MCFVWEVHEKLANLGDCVVCGGGCSGKINSQSVYVTMCFQSFCDLCMPPNLSLWELPLVEFSIDSSLFKAGYPEDLRILQWINFNRIGADSPLGTLIASLIPRPEEQSLKIGTSHQLQNKLYKSRKFYCSIIFETSAILIF